MMPDADTVVLEACQEGRRERERHLAPADRVPSRGNDPGERLRALGAGGARHEVLLGRGLGCRSQVVDPVVGEGGQG